MCVTLHWLHYLHQSPLDLSVSRSSLRETSATYREQHTHTTENSYSGFKSHRGRTDQGLTEECKPPCCCEAPFVIIENCGYSVHFDLTVQLRADHTNIDWHRNGSTELLYMIWGQEPTHPSSQGPSCWATVPFTTPRKKECACCQIQDHNDKQSHLTSKARLQTHLFYSLGDELLPYVVWKFHQTSVQLEQRM